MSGKHLRLETLAILLVIVTVLYAGWYIYDNFLESPPEPVTAVQPTRPLPSAEAPGSATPLQPLPPRYPVALPGKPPADATTPSEPPFPASLEASDDYLRNRLSQLVRNDKLLGLLTLKHFIRKLVVIIDSLPAETVPRDHLPIVPPRSAFLTDGEGDVLWIAQRNGARYLPYLELAEAIPDKALLRLYQGLYPLFQEAYREMGHATGHFNDRLVQVIDHLLATPEVKNPIALVRHINRFKFADPDFESRSAGQKLLLRIGHEQAARFKAKLRSFRQALVGPGLN